MKIFDIYLLGEYSRHEPMSSTDRVISVCDKYVEIAYCGDFCVHPSTHPQVDLMEGLRLDVGSQRRRSGKIKAISWLKLLTILQKILWRLVIMRTNVSECMLLLGDRRGGAFRGPGFWPPYCLDFHVVFFHILSCWVGQLTDYSSADCFCELMEWSFWTMQWQWRDSELLPKLFSSTKVLELYNPFVVIWWDFPIFLQV